jgi:hypothetical protein
MRTSYSLFQIMGRRYESKVKIREVFLFVGVLEEALWDGDGVGALELFLESRAASQVVHGFALGPYPGKN